MAADSYFEHLQSPLQGPSNALPPSNLSSIELRTQDTSDWRDPVAGQRYSSICSPTLSETDANEFRKGTRRILIVGRIEYRDTLGNAYSTDFCLTPSLNGPIMWCPSHNDVR